ncbi:2-nonaprenyl-3-methyl-6-methoxy-1,4-benzoquinol hydroxylase [compost metagenome]
MVKHLDDHLQQLPANDDKSRAILEQMRLDEERHATSALDAGGLRFPAPVKLGMTLLSKVMTKSAYRL